MFRISAPLILLCWLTAASAFAQSSALFPAAGFSVREVAQGFGSLIAIALDETGAPVVSVESGGLMRLRDDDHDGSFEAAQPWCGELKLCQGLAILPDGNAWATGIGPQGAGLYKLVQQSGVRHAELAAPVRGDMGEHGAHAVLPLRDGRLAVVLGNHVQWAGPLGPRSPCDTVYEGHVVPRLLDPNGHATHVRAPGGTVMLFDPRTGTAQVQSCGYRNAYDAALTPQGELLLLDSDMEWDLSAPWYRPVRLVHAISGADFGWRTGSSKAPPWRADTLPAVLDVGRGSPTGMLWCDSPHFPEAWRDTVLAGDWSQGRILAFTLTPAGATFRATQRTLLSGRPLPVTDFVLDRGGDLLITLGGRGTRGAVLRLSGTAPPASHVDSTPGAPTLPLPHCDDSTPLASLVATLSHADRCVRYTAAREVTRRSPDAVAALATTHPLASVRAELLVAWARGAVCSGRSVPRLLVDQSLSLLAPEHERRTRLAAASALQLLLDPGQADTDPQWKPPHDEPGVGTALARLFPSGDSALDRDLALLLARCGADNARAELLAAVQNATDPEEALHLIYALSAVRGASDAATLRPAFARLGALRARPGGASHQGFLDALQRRLLAQIEEPARAAMSALSAQQPAASLQRVAGAPQRERSRVAAFLQNTLDSPERDVREGARVFQKTCAACHRHGVLGQNRGPDLSTVGARMNLQDLLEAVIEPSRQVSDQYRSVQLFTKNELHTGMVLRDDGQQVELLDSEGQVRTVPLVDIEERRFSPLSAMPQGLLDGLSLCEVADLVAFLMLADSSGVTPHAESPWSAPLADGLHGCDGDRSLWTVESGTLRGTASGLKRNAFLALPHAATDFMLEAEVLLTEGNSGIQFRSELLPDGTVRGFQADLGQSWWGCLYEEQGRGVLVKADPLLIEPALDRRGWNHLLVRAQGQDIVIMLNGLESARWRDTSLAGDRIALQLHQGDPMTVCFRNLRIHPLH